MHTAITTWRYTAVCFLLIHPFRMAKCLLELYWRLVTCAPHLHYLFYVSHSFRSRHLCVSFCHASVSEWASGAFKWVLSHQSYVCTFSWHWIIKREFIVCILAASPPMSRILTLLHRKLYSFVVYACFFCIFFFSFSSFHGILNACIHIETETNTHTHMTTNFNEKNP